MIDDTATTGSAFAGGAASIADMQQRLVDGQQRLNGEFAISTALSRQFGRTLTSAFVGLAVQGKGFGDVLSSLAMRLSQLALGAAFKPLEGVFGNIFQSLLSSPSPFSGGSIATPASFPMDGGTGLGGIGGAAAASYASGASASPALAAPSVVLNVTTPDAESFRRSETQLAAVLARAVGQGQRNL